MYAVEDNIGKCNPVFLTIHVNECGRPTKTTVPTNFRRSPSSSAILFPIERNNSGRSSNSLLPPPFSSFFSSFSRRKKKEGLQPNRRFERLVFRVSQRCEFLLRDFYSHRVAAIFRRLHLLVYLLKMQKHARNSMGDVLRVQNEG